ncbi:MAG: DNA primase [Cyclobacteriaceae bacterium]
MRISQKTIAEIHQLIDIEEVVSDFVSLKRKGQNMWACCPFHDEKTPSFSVSPTKGIYKCFGCGKAGDAIEFVKEIEGLDYLEAMKYLAGKYGIEIEEAEFSEAEVIQQNERESLFIVLAFAQDYFQNNLWQESEGQAVGLGYFKERGYNEQIIQSFGLGYTFDKWDGLLKAAQEQGYNQELLERAGLLIKKEDRVYDRFRGRVSFPVHNISGKVIAFGARALRSEQQPKYLNSPETEVYHKSKVLYGLHQAKNALRQRDNCYLVEGYTDVISLHLSDVPNVVSSSGTSLTADQIKLIKRYTSNITVLFDGDAAGVKASIRGVDMILESGANVRVVSFPPGEDPDSYSQELGTTAFKEYLEKEQKDFITFKTELFLKESQGDPIKKAETIKEVVASIGKVPDPVRRAVYLKQCSQLLEIDESILISELNKRQINQRQQQRKLEERQQMIAPPIEPPAETDSESAIEDIIALQEKESIRLLLNYGSSLIEDGNRLYDYLFRELEEIEFITPLYKDILAIFKEELQKGNLIKADYFLKHSTSELKQTVIHVIADRYELSEQWQEKYRIYVPREKEMITEMAYSNVLRLKYRIIRKMISQNLEALKSAGTHEIEDLQKVHSELKKSQIAIADLLGIVISD